MLTNCTQKISIEQLSIDSPKTTSRAILDSLLTNGEKNLQGFLDSMYVFSCFLQQEVWRK